MTTNGKSAVGEEGQLVLRTELLRADVAALMGADLGLAPGGGPVRWELAIDAVRIACTDELLTDTAAIAWARRMLGEGVAFLPGRDDGGYWVAGPTCTITDRPEPAAGPPLNSADGTNGDAVAAPGAGVRS